MSLKSWLAVLVLLVFVVPPQPVSAAPASEEGRLGGSIESFVQEYGEPLTTAGAGDPWTVWSRSGMRSLEVFFGKTNVATDINAFADRPAQESSTIDNPEPHPNNWDVRKALRYAKGLLPRDAVCDSERTRWDEDRTQVSCESAALKKIVNSTTFADDFAGDSNPGDIAVTLSHSMDGTVWAVSVQNGATAAELSSSRRSTPTNTPRLAPTETPRPARIKTPTPQAADASSDIGYLRSLRTDQTLLLDSLSDYESMISSVTESDIVDPDWQLRFGNVIGVWAALDVRAQNRDVPDSLRTLDSKWLSVISELSDAAYLFAQGIDFLDADAIEAAFAAFDRGITRYPAFASAFEAALDEAGLA